MAFIVVLGTLFVLSILVAGILVSAVESNTSTYKDRIHKQAFGGALAGLRTAIYRLNTSGVALNKCPTYTNTSGLATNDPTNGLCGPYSSTDTGAVQNAPGTRWTYWMTPDLGTGGGDSCTGVPPVVVGPTQIQNRCVTAQGQALSADNSRVTARSRVQARIVSGGSDFLIPGIWGTDCVQVGKGGSGAIILGALGSNGRAPSGSTTAIGACPYWSFTADIDLNVSNWGDTADQSADGKQFMGGDVYYGRSRFTDPKLAVLPTAQIIFSTPSRVTSTATFPYTTTPETITAQCPGATTASENKPPQSVVTMRTADCNGTPKGKTIDMKRWRAVPPVTPKFQAPPKPARSQATYGGSTDPALTADANLADGTGPCLTAASTVAAPCDTSRRNDNTDGGITLTNCRTGSGGWDATNRSLNLQSQGGSCVATFKNGVYNFCSIFFSNGTTIRAADTSATAEVYIFVDSPKRTTLPSVAGGSDGGAACPSSTNGNMTNQSTGSGNGTSFMANATTSLAGQLYFYGDGETPGDDCEEGWCGKSLGWTSGSTTTPNSVSHNVVIPNGWQFKGLVQAPNSWVTLGTGVVLQGGLNARAVQVQNGATYAWDAGVTAIDPGLTTFFRSAFSQCTPAIPQDGSGNSLPMADC